jgi:hypothetical protein
MSLHKLTSSFARHFESVAVKFEGQMVLGKFQGLE